MVVYDVDADLSLFFRSTVCDEVLKLRPREFDNSEGRVGREGVVESEAHGIPGRAMTKGCQEEDRGFKETPRSSGGDDLSQQAVGMLEMRSLQWNSSLGHILDPGFY